MLAKKMETALVHQVYEEMYSFYLYLAMAEHSVVEGMPGLRHWMQNQALEELSHAVKFMNYIAGKGGKVELKALQAPPKSWKSAKIIFEEALKHEQHITSCINNLVDTALSLKDHATANFLNWFVAEQVEEEANAQAIIDMIKLTGSAPGGMFIVDRELAARPAALNPLNPTPAA
ncbi:MAG: ferritin [Candidatus Riflebacteria bacterium]|nr:ferritin [Candidatus Riflebacteria bacterium]